MHKDRKNTEDLPLFKKGKEIMEVVQKIIELIPDDNEHLQHTKSQMFSDAALLTVKIPGAESGGLYDIKMEAATIIRKATNDLMIQYHALEMFGFKELEYFNIVRELLEEYRLQFIDWVLNFDKWVNIL